MNKEIKQTQEDVDPRGGVVHPQSVWGGGGVKNPLVQQEMQQRSELNPHPQEIIRQRQEADLAEPNQVTASHSFSHWSRNQEAKEQAEDRTAEG